jgi:hypothetical protein
LATAVITFLISAFDAERRSGGQQQYPDAVHPHLDVLGIDRVPEPASGIGSGSEKTEATSAAQYVRRLALNLLPCGTRYSC